MAAPPKRVERPDHAGRTDVEILHRHRLLPPVPFVGGPELLGVERSVSVRDDRGDRALDARGIPRLFDQRLELRRLVEHAASLVQGRSGTLRRVQRGPVRRTRPRGVRTNTWRL